nr:hypothetical protein BaRGS_014992 [Batillaria attramentaria]
MRGDHSNKSDPGLTTDEIIGQGFTVFIAGYETTATTLQYLTYLLALNPEKQEKLYREIVDTIGNAEPTYDNVTSIKYLDSCVREALRCFPPAALTSRVALAEKTIKGVKIPAGAGVGVPIIGLMRDEEFFPEPDKFIPERFDDENKDAIPSIVREMVFGAGPRQCIGMRLALYEAKMAVVTVVRQFKFFKVPETPVRNMDIHHLVECRIYFMRRPVLMTTDVDILKEVFIKDFANFPDRMMGKFITRCCHNLSTAMRKNTDEGKLLDVKQMYGSFTLDVICGTAFGFETNALGHEDNVFLNNVKALFAKARAFHVASVITGLTTDEIIGQGFTVFIAGYETTASTLQYLTYLLALNPEKQEKLYREIVDTIGNAEPTYDNVASIKYLDSCVREALRCFPPVGLVLRTAIAEKTIKGVKIPAGAGVGVPIIGLMRDEEFFPEPDKFIPERFDDENKDAIPSMVREMVFGAGPRQCLGMRLALYEAKMAVVTVVRQFKFVKVPETPEEVTFRAGVALAMPARPILVGTQLREA